MVPLAHGNDGLGSLRIPGACCGLVAVKPGLGVIPAPEHDWFRMSENGPIATTVADAALALSIMAGDMSFTEALPRSPSSATPTAPGAGADETAWTVSPPELRIAIAPNPLPIGFTMDKEFQHAVDEAGATLRSAGHTVVEHSRRMPVSLGLSAIMTWFSCAAEDTRGFNPRRLENRTRALARAGRVVGAFGLDGATGRKRWRESGADRWLGDADVLITPTLAHLPPRADRWGDQGLIRNTMVNVRYAPVTAAWNLAGWPALTIPFGRHTGGMPIGVQLIAPPGDEARLLGLAAQLEAARPWPRHAPTY
jgi:amidase